MTRPISSIPYWGVRNLRVAQPDSQKLVRSSITNTASIGVSQPRWTTRRRFSARAKPSSTFARLRPRMIANSENAKLNASMLDPQAQAADLRGKGKLVWEGGRERERERTAVLREARPTAPV